MKRKSLPDKRVFSSLPLMNHKIKTSLTGHQLDYIDRWRSGDRIAGKSEVASKLRARVLAYQLNRRFNSVKGRESAGSNLVSVCKRTLHCRVTLATLAATSMTHPSVVSSSLQHRLRLGQWQSFRCAMFTTAMAIAALLVTGVDAATAVGTFSPQTCVKCAGLEYCTIMNGQYLFDPIAGYSRETTMQLEKQGVCEDLDAKTLALSPFGTQLQFKDTPACHILVWNFHCLSWVATTFQRNVNGTPVSCASTGGSAMVSLPPCRSLCVELADKCVYSHFYRMYLDEVCGNIGCLTETQEVKDSGSATSNVAETTCVSGSWVYAENNTFSRCSTRAYEPPAALAVRDASCKVVVALGMLTALWLV